MTRRRHAMPFGAELDGGRARFRIWAPAAARVELVLDPPRRALPMDAVGDGWHELVVEGLAAGAGYAFRVDAGAPVPDPASRRQVRDVNGPSELIDPRAFEWSDDAWRGRPWHEAVLYELHVGTFSPEGTFAGVEARLDYLERLGVTALEIMPVADFAGRRNWGYDGVLPFAPDTAYGTPDEFKRLVAAAHARGIMVLLDVVYNHFGPEGNHLHRYAPEFFNAAHQTPWGAAINFDAARSRTVRDFFIHNALYWIEEFHLDGLRLDAVHAIADDSRPHIVTEMAAAIAAGPGRERPVHMVLENDRNQARLLARDGTSFATAQWNDDWHHAVHVLASGEREGYYADYAKAPLALLGRALAEGFAYQGEPSAHHGGEPRGEPSAGLPPEALIAFLQNHDQVGNRALGERLAALAPPPALRLATAILLLAPSVPLLFMGEEFAASAPFLYFCDFAGELASAVRDGRRREFASFARFSDPAMRERIPDPGAEATFLRSKLPWSEIEEPEHAAWLERYRALIALRMAHIVPHLAAAPAGARGGRYQALGAVLAVDWTLADGARLHLRANLSGAAAPGIARAPGILVHSEGGACAAGELPPWGGAWTVEAAR
jgi:maltooligosyltrehalose trehalohydrolase